MEYGNTQNHKRDNAFLESKTFKNLHTTLEGELKASAKYRIYGAKAREDGFEQIGNIFDETSHNEQEHAEVMMKILFGEVPDTLENLKDASGGETHEFSTLYKQFAEDARAEGYPDIANIFDGIASIERHHDFRFDSLAENIQNGKVFCSNETTLWICLNCGYLASGVCAPEKCPVCGYPQAYFKLNCEDFN